MSPISHPRGATRCNRLAGILSGGGIEHLVARTHPSRYVFRRGLIPFQFNSIDLTNEHSLCESL